MMLKKVPLPVTGVALGLAALGNLLQSYSETVRLFCGALSALLLILFLLKLIRYPAAFAEDMKNPIMASVFCTFPMASMLLAGYLKPFAAGAATALWYAAIILHVVLIVFFTKRFMLNLQMPKVFASYYIVYVGIATASVTAPAFGAQTLGTVIFWFAFAAFLALLVLVTVRYVKYREIPEPARSLFCIYAAPASLCLAGYIQSVAAKSAGMVQFQAVLASALYVLVLVNLPKYLKYKFYPSCAAFTFPFVISAIAIKQTAAFLTKMQTPVPALSYVVLFETAVAVILVFYTLFRYVSFITV